MERKDTMLSERIHDRRCLRPLGTSTADEIEQERAAHAFATLLPSCSCLKQNKEIYNAIVTTVTELATLAPVYHLKCLPDREATELCRKTVEG